MLIARKKRTSYENFVAECPSCGVESIFNRASDFSSFEPIAGRDVACLNVACGTPFRIVGDSINNPHEMLINDCYELIEQKHYMNCILSLTTLTRCSSACSFKWSCYTSPSRRPQS